MDAGELEFDVLGGGLAALRAAIAAAGDGISVEKRDCALA